MHILRTDLLAMGVYCITSMSDADAVGGGRVVYMTARLATLLIVGESH